MLRAFVDVRPEERPGVTGAFLTLFGILAAHTLLETARDALFLARLPPSQLPWVYLAMAVVAVGLSLGPGRGARGLTRTHRLSQLLVSCSMVTFLFWLFGSWENPWTLRALYVWTGLVGTLAGLQFWLVLGEMYTITQAKRIYRVVGLGSVLGAVAGAGLAGIISAYLPASHIVLASACALAITGLGPALVLRRTAGAAAEAASEPVPSNVSEAWQFLRNHPYLTRLAGLVLVSTVTVTFADYVFKSAVARGVPAAHLGSFFASFYMVLNALALTAQLVLTGWILRVLGLHRALWVLPTLVFLGSAGVVFGGGLAAALILKGADGALRPSLHRTTTELLFLPIPDGLRARAKPLIDVVGQRGGQALASIFILGELTLHRGDIVVAMVAALLCVVWIAWALELKPHYLELFRTALRQGSLRDRADLPDLDLASLETLIAALNGRDDAEVVGAMDLLAAEGRERLVPALILYHPSRAVVLRALDLFETSGRSDFVPVADRLLDHADPEVRAAALRARSAAKPEQAVLQKAMDDPSALVRATALVGLVSGGWVSEWSGLDEPLQHSAETQVALARAIRRQPIAAFADVLLRLADAPSPEVQALTAEAMGAVKSARFMPALLHMLGTREARRAARAAFLELGDEALSFLDEALGDLSLPHDIRRHLPRTISRFPAGQAGPILLSHMLAEPYGMVRFRMIRGLGRIATDHPDVRLDNDILKQATMRTLEAAFRLAHWRSLLEKGAGEEPRRATRGHGLLTEILHDKEVNAVERLFRLLGLRYRGENFQQIHRGLRNTDPKVRSGSRELLENLLDPPLREAVLALVDDAADDVRLAHAGPFYEAAPMDYEAVLVTLLESSSETMQSIAAYHVGELGLTALRGRLETIERRRTGFFVSRVVERTLRQLAGPSPGMAHAR
jgi:ATP/ADP translocase/HEAT repeat protein